LKLIFMAEKAVPKKRDQSKRRASYQPKITVNGRPTKRTPEMEKALIAAIETGAPYRIACMAVGITDDTFTNWRRKDPVFAAQVAQASGKTALRLLKKIEANADENFSAAAWILERRFPESFSRPEIQLAAVHNQISLTSNTLVVTAETAGALAARSAPVHAKVEQLFASHTNGSSFKQLGESPSDERLAVAEMKLAPLEMPAGKLTPAWWGQLSRGDNTREIERETAIKICRMILEDVLGKQRAQSTLVEFDPDWPILLRDVHSKIESLCGARGWDALVKRGKARK
jgi:transposase